MADKDRVERPPQASLPNCVELIKTYDVERMQSELAEFAARSGSCFSAASGRRILPLRSIAGDPYRTDSGGPNVPGFRDTVWLEHLPYFREVLKDLPAPVRAARLRAAGPGSKDVALRTAKLGPPWGLCRLHLPAVVGGTRAHVFFFEERHRWSPGTLWFTAAWREYALVNQDESELVHLIVEVYYTEELSALFPTSLRDTFDAPHVLPLRPTMPLPGEAQYLCRFWLPESFVNWERPGHLLYSEMKRPHHSGRRVLIPGSIETSAGIPLLVLAGRPFSALEHIGNGEFRLQGWSDERTIQVTHRPDAPALLRLREGERTYLIELPADKAPTESGAANS
jgi:aspartate beta-hydroxylase